MRQTIITLNIIGSFVIFASVVNLFDTIVMFVLFGIMPGQSEALSANQMLAIYCTAFLIVAAYAVRNGLVSIIDSIELQRSSI